MRRLMLSLIGLTVVAAATAQAQAPGEAPRILRPGLLFKEEWKQSSQGGEHPVTADSIGNPNLDLKLYVPAGQIMLTGRAGDENAPIHLWLGLCTSPCAVALRDKSHVADLTGLARIRWNTKMSGLHQVRPIVKLADGSWWVGDRADGSTRDWIVSEISFADVHWIKLDIARVVTVGVLMDKIDLSRVDEIGFADLMPGSGHGPGGWSDVAQIEVYGQAIARGAAAK
ncbi:MAG TPA: hypothetical protein VLW26_02345 [Steroidobacteraceae bacterium]|nr:hypothetical protein [Steroidobacteraceae bacterium]